MWDMKNLIYLLPDVIKNILAQAKPSILEQISEIRLRANQPLAITTKDKVQFLSEKGLAVSAKQGFFISQELVQETLFCLCGHSLHGIEKTLEQGYFTAPGGFRVGVCMQPFGIRQGLVRSLCIRLPRQVLGAAERVYSMWRDAVGFILAGPPASGKTTLLRDLCRIISTGNEENPCCRTVLIDERNELSGWDGAKSAFELGPCTDVLSGIPKQNAIMQAIRTLSPQVILCDEIADENEAAAIQYAFYCGVRFVVTVHCGSWQEVRQNIILQTLMQSGAFSHIDLLGLPAGSAEGVVMTKDEYDRKTTGFGAGSGRVYSNGLYTGIEVARQPKDGGIACTILE